MLFDLRLTKINPNMTSATVECLYAQVGTQLKMGDKLLDLSVDLSSGYSQYCPPISYFRTVVRERVWLRTLQVAVGNKYDLDSQLAIFSTEPDEDVGGGVTRQLRITTAGIAYHPAMWSASER